MLSGQARTSRFPDTPIIPGFHHSMVPVVWQSCKTNPIWPRRPEMGAHGPAASINCAKRSQFPAAPGGARPEGRGSWVDCAERSQFASGRPGEVRGTRAAESNHAKRTQFGPRAVRKWARTDRPGALRRGSIVQNEANLKRSFRFEVASVKWASPNIKPPRYPDYSSIRPFHDSSCVAIVQNKANLAPGVRKWARSGRLGAPGRARLCETKPIPGGARWAGAWGRGRIRFLFPAGVTGGYTSKAM